MRPLFFIWIKPKKTFEYIEKRDVRRNRKATNTLVFFATMYTGFANAHDMTLLLGADPYVGLLVTLIFAGLTGLLLFHIIITPVLLMVSRLFQGKATSSEIKIAYAYSLVPNLVYLVFGLIIAIISLSLTVTDEVSYINNITYYIIWLFSINILIHGLAYFNKYSYGYAILTFLIPAALIQGLIFMVKNLI